MTPTLLQTVFRRVSRLAAEPTATDGSDADLLRRRAAEGAPGVHALDIETCLQANVFDFVMRAAIEPVGDAGLLTLRAYNQSNA